MSSKRASGRGFESPQAHFFLFVLAVVFRCLGFERLQNLLGILRVTSLRFALFVTVQKLLYNFWHTVRSFFTQVNPLKPTFFLSVLAVVLSTFDGFLVFFVVKFFNELGFGFI